MAATVATSSCSVVGKDDATKTTTANPPSEVVTNHSDKEALVGMSKTPEDIYVPSGVSLVWRIHLPMTLSGFLDWAEQALREKGFSLIGVVSFCARASWPGKNSGFQFVKSEDHYKEILDATPSDPYSIRQLPVFDIVIYGPNDVDSDSEEGTM